MEMDATGGLRMDPAQGPAARVARIRFGLGLKVVAIAAVSTAIVAVILALSFAREVEKVLRDELTSRGRLAALTLANTSTTLLFSQDVSGLQALATSTLADVTGARYVIVRDERGQSVAEAVDPALGAARPAAIPLAELSLGTRFLERTVPVGDAQMLHVLAVIEFRGKAAEQYMDPLGLGPAGGAGAADGKVLGTVEIGFGLAELAARIGAASSRSGVLALLVFGACLLAIYPVARFTTKPLAELSRAALGIAEGDLRQQVARDGNDEVAEVGRSFAVMISGLQAMQADLGDAATALARESEAMLEAATRQAAAAAEQSASLAQMNAAIQEIAQTARMTTEHADRVIAVTQSAEESAAAGATLVGDAVGSTADVERHVGEIAVRLGELSGRVGQIGAIIETVQDLAQRSNVLALNAAIQASRTGESGAAFAVIAREMRALAEESRTSAGEVPKLLGDIVAATKTAASATELGTAKARSTATLADRTGATIGSLAGVCRESAEAARQIAESARQQASGVNEVVSALAQLAQSAEGGVAGGEEMRRVAERLQAASGRLTGIAQRYRS